MQAAEELVKQQLEPMLKAYTPAGISSLTLDKFHLGRVPPQIDGKVLVLSTFGVLVMFVPSCITSLQ